MLLQDRRYDAPASAPAPSPARPASPRRAHAGRGRPDQHDLVGVLGGRDLAAQHIVEGVDLERPARRRGRGRSRCTSASADRCRSSGGRARRVSPSVTLMSAGPRFRLFAATIMRQRRDSTGRSTAAPAARVRTPPSTSGIGVQVAERRRALRRAVDRQLHAPTAGSGAASSLPCALTAFLRDELGQRPVRLAARLRRARTASAAATLPALR